MEEMADQQFKQMLLAYMLLLLKDRPIKVGRRSMMLTGFFPTSCRVTGGVWSGFSFAQLTAKLLPPKTKSTNDRRTTSTTSARSFW
jgi:hypothetical protein